jgi:hypothetical protein
MAGNTTPTVAMLLLLLRRLSDWSIAVSPSLCPVDPPNAI